jgi:hypothetical protein
MATDIEKLKKEIEELERQIEAHPFGGLLDRNRQEQLFRKLKKKRKELAGLEKTKGAKPVRGKAAGKKKSART